MVLSKINNKVSYKELKKLDPSDINKEAELFQIVAKDVDIIIALGNAKQLKEYNITYYPIYLVKENGRVMQIGVYEIHTAELPKFMIKETQALDLELLDEEPLIYVFITKKILEELRKVPEETIYEMEVGKEDERAEEREKERAKKMAEDKEKAKETAMANLEEGEEYEDEEDIEMKKFRKAKAKAQEEEEKKEMHHGALEIPPIRQHIFKPIRGALVMALLPEETKHMALSIKEGFTSLPSKNNWLQEFMHNSNYSIKDNEGNGDCFFAVVRDAFEQLGQATTIRHLREALARDETERVFMNYKDIYRGAESAYKEEKKQMEQLQGEYDKYKKLIANTINKAEQKTLTTTAKKIKAHHDKIFLEAKFSKKTLTDNKFMKGVDTLAQFKEKVMTTDYWADESAISRLERILNVKFILLSNQAYKAGDLANVLNCGETDERIQKETIFRPEFYIICDYSGIHYQLIKYKKKGIFTFTEIPYDIKKLIVHKCMERNSGGFSLIPEFKEFKEKLEEKMGSAAAAQDEPAFQEISDAKLRGLYDDNILFVFYNGSASNKAPGKGPQEKMPTTETIKEFAQLAAIPDWRKKLDNGWPQPFMLDGHRWQTVDHYLAAVQFKDKFPEFYLSFSLESGTPLSKDLEIVKCALSASGKCRGSKGEPGQLIRPKEVTLESLSKEREKVELENALLAKFGQNEDLKNLLLNTKNAALAHYKKSSEPVLLEPLMIVRENLKE